MVYLIDLTHKFEENISRFGNLPRPIISTYTSHEDSVKNYSDGCSFEITEVCFVTSLGTYLDAPRHRYKNKRDISDLSLNELVKAGILINSTHKREREPITRNDIEIVLSSWKHTCSAVLIWTGWDKYWKNELYKEGPYLDESAALTLLDYGIRLVGIDTLNIDDYKDSSRPVHSLLLHSDCLIVENLMGLNQLEGKKFEFAAIPMKMKGAASFPVRAFARIIDSIVPK